MMVFANFDLVAICENDLKPKIFLPMDMALYTIYRGTPAPRQGPNSHQTHFNNWPASL